MPSVNTYKYHSILISGLFVSLLVWSVLLYFLADKNSIYNYAYNAGCGLFYFAGGFSGLNYALRLKNKDSLVKAVYFTSLALIVWGMAAFIWFYFNVFGQIEIPYPSLADFFYISFSLFIGIASWYLLEISEARFSRKNFVEPFIVILFVYIIIVLVVSRPAVLLEQSILANVFDFLNPIANAFLFSIALISYRLDSKMYKPGLVFIASGLLVQTIGDLTFSYREINNIYWNGDISDLLYVVSGFLIYLGINYFIKNHLKQQSAN